MKKRLICFSVLASFIIGLVLVGSCKDYDDFALDIRVQNLENQVDATSSALMDSINDLRATLSQINSCACVPSQIKDSIKKLYDFLGGVLDGRDTVYIDSANAKKDTIRGLQNVINYVNRQLTLTAAAVEALDGRVSDSLHLAYDTAKMAYAEAKWVADSLRNHRFGIGDSIWRATDSAAKAYAMASQNKIDIGFLRNRTKELSDSLADLYKDTAAIKSSIRDHLERIKALEARKVTHTYYDSLERAYKGIDSLAQVTYNDSVRIDELAANDVALNKRIDSLAIVTYNDSIRTKTYFEKALEYADSIGDTVRNELLDSIRDHRVAIHDLSVTVNEHSELIRTVRDSLRIIDTILNNFKLRLDTLNLRVDTLNLRVDTLNLRVDTLNNRVDTLELKVDSLKDAREKNISGIRINGTKNDVFGSFSLPINLRSNILMTYYKDFKGKKFPTEATTSNIIKGSYDLNDRDIELLGDEGLGILEHALPSSDKAVGAGSANAGKLYFTLNPNDVKIDDSYEFYLINSLGDSVPVALSHIKKSTDKLKFGYNPGYAVNGQVIEDSINTVNGFYQADVRIESSVAPSLKPDLDKEALKSIVSDIKNYSDGINFQDIAYKLVNAVNGVLDANALYVTWEDKFGKHSATSDYDLAVTAIPPLSYNTFNSLPLPSFFDKKIPENPIQYLLTRLENKAKSEAKKITLNLGSIKVKDVTFEIPVIEFDSATVDKSVVINITKGDYSRTITVPFTKKASQEYRDPLCEELTALKDVLDLTSADVEKVVNTMKGDIQKQANKILRDVQITVRSQVTKAIGKLTDEAANNKYVKKVEKLANRLASYYNSIGGVEGLGRYLVEPTMLYLDDNGDLHPMSSSALVATPSSSRDFDIVLTSLTNEMFTPAYKKFVAVTNYSDGKGGEDWQTNRNESVKNIIETINNGNGQIGVVLDGNTPYITFNAPQDGVYELLLSTIDYSGFIFNRKFYVSVGVE